MKVIRNKIDLFRESLSRGSVSAKTYQIPRWMSLKTLTQPTRLQFQTQNTNLSLKRKRSTRHVHNKSNLDVNVDIKLENLNSNDWLPAVHT